ncbi:outer membrane protein assembly factor BamA [Pararhodobacter marinus]|uniref:Outer membrane protein assembly factor BamA n=2 Tax=Pararhodobacter marinus TaxID=2184063 RepID=A0A2U2CBF0_9RHOB|nr:outer membrane protein assembly factor BamA [Pararhodobacter marinus]
MRISHVDMHARALGGVMKPLRGLAAVFLFSSAISIGAASGALAQSYSFSSIDVQGNTLIDDDQIISYARILRGRNLSAADLNAAYQRVAATGFFREVDFVPQGNRLVITVQEYPLINRVSIEGNRRLDDDDLSATITSRSGGVYSPATAEADANAIAEAYANAGRLSARVNPVIIERQGGRVDLVFEVQEGAVVEVERISFVGNRTYSERRLRNAIETAQAGRLSTLFRVDNYNEQRVARDRQALHDFYLSRGFIDVQVLSGITELNAERDGAYVTFTIREGQQYRLGNITVTSQISGIDAAPYQAGLIERPGTLFTPTLLENIIQQAERVGYESGERFVRAEPTLVRNERDGTIDVELTLIRGERVFIERIDIQGNVTTEDRVIRRQFDVAEGDPLNPRELREAAARIQRTGFFSDVQVNPVGGSTPDQAVVDVRVEEATTGSLGFGLSYGADDGVGGNISYNENNFLGRGQRLNVTLSTLESSQAVSLSFTEPAFLGRNVALGLNVGLSTSSANDSAYFSTEVAQFSPSLTFPVSEYGELSVRTSISRYSLTPASPRRQTAPRILRDRGSATTASVGYTYSFDTRDTGIDPDRGFVFRFSQDLAGVDRNWLRSTMMAGYEQHILNGDVTLRVEFEAGAIIHGDDASRINERFVLSSEQFRGFSSYGIGPVGYSNMGGPTGGGTRNGLGGNFFAVARFEAEFPLGLPQEYNLHGGAFLDVGSIWGIDQPGTICAPGVTQNCVIDEAALRAAAGVSLFWSSPLGPLRFNFAVPIMIEDYDRERRFDLTVATRF